jgi:hypothetical protein
MVLHPSLNPAVRSLFLLQFYIKYNTSSILNYEDFSLFDAVFTAVSILFPLYRYF